MSLTVTNTSDNGHGFGNHHALATGGGLMSCHDPYPSLQPWTAVSAAIGHFGAATPMTMPMSMPTPMTMPIPMPQGLPVVDANPIYPYPRPGGGGTITSASQAAGLFPASDLSSCPPPPAGPGTASSSFGAGFEAYAVRGMAPDAMPTTSNALDVTAPLQQPPPPPPPVVASIANSVNPNDLSADLTGQARSVIVQIAGDVGRFLTNKKEDVKPPKTTTPPKAETISIAEGHSPAKGFTIDYFGLDDRFKSGWAGRAPVPGAAPMPFSRPPQKIGWCEEEGDEDPTFLCQICGLKWRGVSNMMLRGRNPPIWDDGMTVSCVFLLLRARGPR